MKSKTLQKVIAVLLALGLLMSYIPAAVTAETTVAQQDGQIASKFVDRSASTVGPSEEVNLAPIQLTAGSMAYAIEIRSTDTFYKIPDLDVPGTWQAVATAATYYAGDFLEGDFSKIYAVSELNVLHTIDTTTGLATEIMSLATPEGYGYQGIAGAEGFFYGTSSDCGTETLISTINPTTGEIVVVVETAIACGIDIAYAPDRGLLYIVDIVTDHLYSVDPVTENVVDVGALGFEAGYAQGMDYDEATQILYWAAYGSGGNGQLRTINMDTGASALVGAFPGDNETDCLSIATYAGGGDYEINGTVRSETGLLLEGAKVVINPDGEGFPRTAYTDELGAYSAAVDAGVYNLTASKLGYLNETKTATVPEGATAPVIVDFALDVIPATSISGTVTDGGIIDSSMHGYPLLATVVFKAADHTLETQTDPFTGEYAIEIFASTDYQVTVTAALPGYLPATRHLVGAFDAVQDFALNVDAGACSAPGYAPGYAYFFDFETGAQGFTFGGTNSSWGWGEFTSGPGEAVSGTKGIATNPAGQYNISELSWAMSPVLDLSGVGATETALLEWWNWLYTESATSTWDVASVEFTKNGGTTWTTVWGPFPRQDTQYQKELIEINPSYYVDDFQFRFWFKTDFSGLRDGWYIDNVGLGLITVDPTVTEVESFHFDDGTEPIWTTGSTGTGANSWAKGVPTTGPGAAHSDPNVWATNLNGNYNASEVSFITSPVMDFSEHAGSAITVSYWDWLQTESITSNWDVGRLKASADGGATFTTLLDNIKRKDTVGTGFTAQSIQLSPSFTTDKFQFRFEFKSDSSGHYLGWYLDDVSFGVAEPVVIPCGIVDGGIVAGYVFDANFPEVKLTGATVATDTNAAVTDPSLDGLYYMFQAVESDPEDVQFTISYPNYETKTETREIDQDVVNRQDFELDAGLIISSPLALERTIFLHDDPEFTTLTLINEGAGGANFAIREVDKGFQPYSIPVFTGKLEPSQEPASIYRDPNASKIVGGLELNALSVHYGITAAPPAYGIDLFTDSLYNWPDAAVPGTSTLIGTPAATSLFAGDFMGSDFDTLYGISYDNNKLYAIDTATAVATEIGTTVPPTGTFGGLSGGPGVMYGIATECNVASTLVEVDLDTAAVTTIGTLPNATCMIDIAYVPSEDAIYGVDLVTNSLHRIDPATGVDTIVGNLGVDANYAQGMDYDEENGILYWAAYTTVPELRIIDIYTGASVAVGAFTQGEVDAYAIAAGGSPVDMVPWLDEDPLEGFVPAQSSFPIEIEFNVNGIDQPGDYFAELKIETDTPYSVPSIPVTLHVIRPLNYGNIKATVYALEKCDINPMPAENATINFYQNGVLVKSTKTDENGYFSYSLKNGSYDVEIVLADYIGQMVTGVQLGWDEDLVLDDIVLRLDAACLTYTPEFVYQELFPGETAQQTLTFTNTGANIAVFEISEIVGDGPVPFAKGDVELILDDGSAENAIGIGGTAEFIFLNHFTPAADQFPFTLEEVQVSFEASGNMNIGDEFRVVIYQNLSGNSNPAIGSELLYQFPVTAENTTTWNYYPLPEPVTFEGPGDVLIGLIAMTVPGSDYFPAALDENSTHQRSWAGWWTGAVPTEPTLPPSEEWTLIDAYYPGNWLVRGMGTQGGGGGTPGDIVWLTVDPMADVVMPDGGSVEVTLTFDSTDLLWGDYFGALRVINTPDPRFDIPVQLRVKPFFSQYLPAILRELPIPARN